MGSLGAIGGGSLWGMDPFRDDIRRRREKKRSGESKSSTGGSSGTTATGSLLQFPLKQATTAAFLALTGDTISQLRQRWVRSRNSFSGSEGFQVVIGSLFSEHDWIRALRMLSYGFLLYGPGSYAWYRFLDHRMPEQTFLNLSVKVLLNQTVLGPSVIAVVFAWDHLWQGKLAQLPDKYKNDALPTLFTGFRFWIPVSVMNFRVVPVQFQVAFMSMASIFWNFYLSSTMSK